jgi:spore coat polysaccharide biosynthesis protein SpsF
MVLAILQARMSSSRLPGKVLKPILDKPILAYQIERIKQSIFKLFAKFSKGLSSIPIEVAKTILSI